MAFAFWRKTASQLSQDLNSVDSAGLSSQPSMNGRRYNKTSLSEGLRPWNSGFPDLYRQPFGRIAHQVLQVPQEQVAVCLEHQRQFGGRVGGILHSWGLLTRVQIAQVLKIQSRCVGREIETENANHKLPFRIFLSMCMPAYNEAANIEDTLDAACAILPEFVERFEIIVVDDGSKDGTGEIVAQYAKHAQDVRLVSHEQNRGYGAAVTTALRAARGDYVAFTDSDGQFSFLDLPQLLIRLEKFDVVVGYRYHRADPWHRRLNAWAWGRLIRFLLRVRVRDLDCAFKIFPRKVIGGLSLTANGAGINAEILAQCVRSGLTIGEIPVNHYPRYHGAPTGAALRVILKAFRELPRMLKYRFGRRPILIYEPINISELVELPNDSQSLRQALTR